MARQNWCPIAKSVCKMGKIVIDWDGFIKSMNRNDLTIGQDEIGKCVFWDDLLTKCAYPDSNNGSE